MADKEILACSKFEVQFDGLEGLYVKSVTGIKSTLLAAGADQPYACGKGGKTQMQATVTGVQSDPITVVYVASATDKGKLIKKWYDECHSQAQVGGGTAIKGARKTGSIILFNQAGEEAARWNITGAMCKSYTFSDMEAGAEDLATETVEVAFEHIHRIK